MVDVWGTPSTCVPLVFEHFGRWGEQAHQFLDQLSLQSVDEDGRENSKEFKTFWRRCFSVALQRCNASVLRRKLSRIAQFRNRSPRTFHCAKTLRFSRCRGCVHALTYHMPVTYQLMFTFLTCAMSAHMSAWWTRKRCHMTTTRTAVDIH